MHSQEAMALSDVDATYFELEQAALEHSLETHVQFEHGKKQRASSAREQKSQDECMSANALPFSLADPSSPPLLVSQSYYGMRSEVIDSKFMSHNPYIGGCVAPKVSTEYPRSGCCTLRGIIVLRAFSRFCCLSCLCEL